MLPYGSIPGGGHAGPGYGGLYGAGHREQYENIFRDGRRIVESYNALKIKNVVLDRF